MRRRIWVGEPRLLVIGGEVRWAAVPAAAKGAKRVVFFGPHALEHMPDEERTQWLRDEAAGRIGLALRRGEHDLALFAEAPAPALPPGE